jgi:hypothetical protein
MSYLLDEIKEYYKDRIDPGINKFTAMRKLQDDLENNGFDAKEIQLLSAIINDVIQKHGGSREEIFRALYKGYRL